jgi:hypothetical protein
MTTFDRREDAFEAMFAHDEDINFRAAARQAKMLAGWVGDLQQLPAESREIYSENLVQFCVAHPGDAALFERLRAGLKGAVADQQIRERMAVLKAEALRAVRAS